MLSLLMFPFEWKSTSCNANAINVLFTGREGHTHAHVHKEYISCPFSRFAASMMAAQNEVNCGLMEFSCPIIFFSFVQLIIPLWAFFIPSTGRGGWHPGSLALGHAAHYDGTSWYQKHKHTLENLSHKCISWLVWGFFVEGIKTLYIRCDVLTLGFYLMDVFFFLNIWLVFLKLR